MPNDNTDLVMSLAAQVDRLSGQVAALSAIIAMQPATDAHAIATAKPLMVTMVSEKLNPKPGLTPQEHGSRTIDRIGSEALLIGTVRGAGGR